MVEVGLEVACPAAEPRGDLRQHAPGEVLVPAETLVPCREDRGIEALRVPVGVARQRPDVVRGGHPEAAASARPPTSPRTRTQPRNVSWSAFRGSGPVAQALANLAERPCLEHAAGSAAASEAARPGGRQRRLQAPPRRRPAGSRRGARQAAARPPLRDPPAPRRRAGRAPRQGARPAPRAPRRGRPVDTSSTSDGAAGGAVGSRSREPSRGRCPPRLDARPDQRPYHPAFGASASDVVYRRCVE